MTRLIHLVLACILFSCQSKKEKIGCDTLLTTKLSYAKGFSVSYLEHAKLVEVNRPYQEATSGFTYLLVERGYETPKHDANTKVIQIPLQSIVCTSTSHIPLLDYLDLTDKLKGFTTTDYISSEKMRKRIDAGLVKELGVDKAMDLELLTIINPDALMSYTMSGDLGQFKKIEELGIPVIINAEYLESHPLGRAEWIKFMALFFNKEKEADSIFSTIETNYIETKKNAEASVYQSTVLSGIVYGDNWFLPGGRNYQAQIFRDAGYNYLWSSDTTSGFLSLGFESVYQQAKDADYWIGVGSFMTFSELDRADHRYEKFKAFQRKNVYTYDARQGAKGGSEFLELGYLRPDIILKDLVKIGHPSLLPEHQLYFHAQLK